MKNVKKMLAPCLVLAIVCTLALTTQVFAGEFSDGDSFTQIFKTRGFMGNTAILQKLSWVSKLVSDVISVCGFLGVSLTVIRLMLSLLYKSNPTIFDEISEIKASEALDTSSVKGFGTSMANKFLLNPLNKASSKGGLFDTVIYFVLSHMPDVKSYSDFKDGGEFSSDTPTLKYMLRISPKIILQIFFFSIAWNGVLMQAYGSVVDGLGVAAERFVTTDFADAVSNLLNTGEGYSFTYKAENSERGTFRQALATGMYNSCVKKLASSSRSAATYQQLGDQICKYVSDANESTLLTIASKGSSKNVGSDADIEKDSFWTKGNVQTGEWEVLDNYGTITIGNKEYLKLKAKQDNKMCYCLAANMDGMENPAKVTKPFFVKDATEDDSDITGSANVSIGAYKNLACNTSISTSLPPELQGKSGWFVNGSAYYFVATLVGNRGETGDLKSIGWKAASADTTYYLTAVVYYQDAGNPDETWLITNDHTYSSEQATTGGNSDDAE